VVVDLLSVMLFLSVLGPLLFYFARPVAAARLARKYPVRQFSLTGESIQVTAGGQTSTVPWTGVKKVWEAGDFVLLVLGKYGSINIPRRSLPNGAMEFILAAAENTG
jgi:hypothetical protein